MFETFMIMMFTLLIVLYVQARFTARDIRLKRARAKEAPLRDLVLKRRV